MTRDRLLSAAATVIADGGWERATTRRIAATAGLNPALVNYHFGSKEELLLSACEKVLSDLMVEVSAGSSGNPDLRATLRAASATIRVDSSDDKTGRVLLEALKRASTDTVVRDRLRGFLFEFRRYIADVVSAGVEAGDLSSDLDPMSFATAVAAALDGLYLYRTVDPTIDVDSALDSFEEMAISFARKGRR